MFGHIFIVVWVTLLVKADQCELYKAYVKFRGQCEALCDYISPCESYTYSPDTHQCQVWTSPGLDRETRKLTGKDPQNPCQTRPCDVTDICVPVKATTQHICLQYNSICSCGLPETKVGNASLVSAPDTPTDPALALYACDHGFARVAGSNTTTCQSAKWSQLTLVCHEITCTSSLWMIPNATTGTITSSKYGATVTYTCQDGYRSTTGNTSSYCQETGEWSEPTLQCEEINCNLPVWVIPNTTSTNLLSSKYGDTVTYSCAVGYTYMEGNDTSYCQENAEWTKPTITCQVIQCLGDIPAIQNTTISMTSSNYADIVTYSCVDGYKYIGGNGTSVCQESATWSQATIVCAEWEEWGWKVLDFSSQYGETGYRAVEILGEFDLYPNYGDKAGAWAPLKGNCPNDKEWIEVQFAESLYIRRIDIYETNVAGVVKTVFVGKDDGTWSTIWTTVSVTKITQSRIFSPQFTTPAFLSDRVRFETDCSTVSRDWVEFDAIKIFGLKFPPST